VRRGFFSTSSALVKAIDRVSLTISRGEILGLVGESGCGKSTLARVALALEPPTSGRVFFEGRDLSRLDRDGIKRFRRRVQMVFQDPFSSLNPKKNIFQILSEPLRIHKMASGSGLRERVHRLLASVGMDSPGIDRRYPHEFSGGQRQRIGIARALATDPALIIADEPTSALDVSVQAQIITLLMELHEKRGISYLFISHDLPLVQFVSHRIAVMYMGNLVELMPRALFERGIKDLAAAHPYTRYLLSAVPVPDPGFYSRDKRSEGKKAGSGQAPEPPVHEVMGGGGGRLTEGCVFADRCPEAVDLCLKERPRLRRLQAGHLVACHRVAP
jgi:oligopeptide/dipeptide ABC transporter ATP-binding protein